MESALKTILYLSLGGTVLAAMLMLLGRLLKKRIPASFYYYAWLIVLLRFVLPLPGLLPAQTAAEPVSAAPVVYAAPRSATAGTTRVYTTDIVGAGAPALEETPKQETAPESAAASGGTQAVRFTLDRAAALDTGRRLLRSWDFWGAVYFTGAALSLLWYFGGYFRFKRRLFATLKSAKESDLEVLRELHGGLRPALYRSRAVKTPMLMGLLRPVIVLPDRSYTPDMLRGILRHELTHYERGDVAYKWFAVAVSAAHWFNPFLALFRREIDRACELSCDERLLRVMDGGEKQNYGELLLALAADRSLPRRVVAMSFATEKRNLKERLVQIMTYKQTGRAGLALMLAVLVLMTGCAGALGPAAPETAASPAVEENAPTPETAADAAATGPTDSPQVGDVVGENVPELRIVASTVDELLEALGPDRVIQIPAGTLNLTEAADYGGASSSEFYSWEEVYDGFALKLRNLENLYIVGLSAADTSIVTEPRYANVLSFESCSGVQLFNFTAGHTPERGSCAGGVLDFAGTDDVLVTGCALFGCGILGVSAYNCRHLSIVGSEIYECSFGAVEASGCYDVYLNLCKIHNCGGEDEENGMDIGLDIFRVTGTTGFMLRDSEITDNKGRTLLRSESNVELTVAGCRFEGNTVGEAAFVVRGESPVVTGCSFDENRLASGWYADQTDGDGGGVCVDADGNALAAADFEAMEHEPYTELYLGPHVPDQAAPGPEAAIGENGELVYHVDNMDDFLAAIGSDTVIYLDEGLFDFTTASNYGGYGGDYYYWVDLFDGPGLVIAGVQNLSIIGAGKDKTTLQVDPRYAEVLNFVKCENVFLSDLTAGHRKDAPGSCAGDVLEFQDCKAVEIRGCGLFGCGVNGVNADHCSGFVIEETEIYECSTSGLALNNCENFNILRCELRDCPEAAYLYNCEGFCFEGCQVHDCEYNAVMCYGENREITWDGEALENGNNFV